MKVVPEVGQLETDLESSLEELLEKRIEALEERFGILLDNDFQLELLEQIFDLDQESLELKNLIKNLSHRMKVFK